MKFRMGFTRTRTNVDRYSRGCGEIAQLLGKEKDNHGFCALIDRGVELAVSARLGSLKLDNTVNWQRQKWGHVNLR